MEIQGKGQKKKEGELMYKFTNTGATELEAYQTLVNRLCSRWGLEPIKVRISEKQTVVAGSAHYRRREIVLGEWLLETAPPNEVDDTIRHEFAHFLAHDTYGSNRHGPNWRRAATVCGARPEQHYSDALNAKRIQYHNNRRRG